MPVLVIAIAMCVFHIFILMVYPIAPWVFRSGHLTFALILTPCAVPFRKNSSSIWPVLLDVAVIAVSLAVMAYVFFSLKR